MTDDMQRTSALHGLIQDLPALAGEILEIAGSIMDPNERATGIAAIAASLPENLRRRALAIIDDIPGDNDKGRALAALVPYLDDRHLVRASTLADALHEPS